MVDKKAAAKAVDGPVYLHWAWGDSRDHSERKAAYENLAAARAQADHDLKLATDSSDMSQAPLRITEGEDGPILWQPDASS